jgi:hypothetical protein
MSHVCRACGSENIRTVEDLSGSCDIVEIVENEDGSLEYDLCGYTEVYWDSSETTGYECGDCYERFPTLEELVVKEAEFVEPEELAAMLGNLA